MTLQKQLEALRQAVASGETPLRITTHARTEARKDGLLQPELVYVFNAGSVVEEYPKESRVLLLSYGPECGLPIHVVVELSVDEVVIITAYVPDPAQWIGAVKRRKGVKK